MIKQLRRKFVSILMLTVTLILLGIVGTVLITTYRGIARNEYDALHDALLNQNEFMDNGTDPGTLSPPPDALQDHISPDASPENQKFMNNNTMPFHRQRIPILIISIENNGSPIIERNQLHFVETEDIEAIAGEVLALDNTSGMLKSYGLRYERQLSNGVTRIALMDSTGDNEMLRQLLINALLIGACAELSFLILSILLSRWAVRPVERVWSQQKQFVADASHELKTPLTVILSNTDILRRDTDAGAETMRHVNYIYEESIRMKTLVEDLLTLAQTDAEHPSLTLSEVDFSFQVENAVLLFEPIIYESNKSITSEITPKLTLLGDIGKLQQLIQILLDNAQKYSPDGSCIAVSLTRTEKKQALLSVLSLGDPIPTEECQQIFTRFYQRDQARVSSSGFGLGLSIAQSITHAHKGKIWAESQINGNIFYVQLPLL